jgi:hypothetical protein
MDWHAHMAVSSYTEPEIGSALRCPKHTPVISWYTSMPVVVSRYVATVSSGLTSVAFVTMPCMKRDMISHASVWQHILAHGRHTLYLGDSAMIVVSWS